MKHLGKFAVFAALTTLVAGADIMATTSPASAMIACNGRGDCWHVRERFDYPHGAGITIHEDNWRWGRREHYRFREHDGRGYWRGGVWINL